MKSKKHAVRVPPITRVHNLYRFRFTVNEITALRNKQLPPTSVSFEKYLTDYQLSKYSTLKPRDRQGRRSRDHLATCTYLGLLDRRLQANEYFYFPTPLGNKLNKYNFREECPKDLDELTVFTAALLQFKLINGHYDDATFKKLRYRPFISILHALKICPLHLNQLYYFCGKIEKDVTIDRDLHFKILERVGNIRYQGENGIELFQKDFKLTEADIDEVNRSIRPWVTWATQIGLIWLDENLFCHSTQKGNILFEHFQNKLPLWFQDLGVEKIRKAVLLLLLKAASLENKRLSKEFINSQIEFEQAALLTTKNELLLDDIQNKFDIISKDLSKLNVEIIFDFYNDVPPEYQYQIESAFNNYSKQLGITTSLSDLNLHSFETVKKIISDTPEEKEVRTLSQLYGFVPPRRELFRVDFEYYSCLTLRRLGFNADKYQGNLSELVRESLKNFVENNPDILVTNDIAFLIECKSKEEWKEESSFNKRILGELKSYDDYAEEVKANCAILLVESEFEKAEFYSALIDELQRLKKILFVSYSYLLDSVQNKSLLQTFKRVAVNPLDYSGEERLFLKK